LPRPRQPADDAHYATRLNRALSRAQNNAINVSASHKVASNTELTLWCVSSRASSRRRCAAVAPAVAPLLATLLHPNPHSCFSRVRPPPALASARSYNFEDSSAVAKGVIKVDSSTIKPEVSLTNLGQWKVNLSHKLTKEDTLEADVNQDLQPKLTYTRKQNDFEVKLSAPVSKEIRANATLKLTRTFEL
jgi:hypothetical protein